MVRHNWSVLLNWFLLLLLLFSLPMVDVAWQRCSDTIIVWQVRIGTFFSVVHDYGHKEVPPKVGQTHILNSSLFCCLPQGRTATYFPFKLTICFVTESSIFLASRRKMERSGRCLGPVHGNRAGIACRLERWTCD